MGEGFSSTKSYPQEKVLASLHRHEVNEPSKFSMPKRQRKQTHTIQPPQKTQELRPTFIKQWRKKKDWSQTQLGDAVGLSTATISQIESGKQGYTQANLEAIACALECQVVDLLIRDPNAPESIWTLWAHARPEQREQMTRMFSAFLRSNVA
jgi:transcriptional regulator with XRE-family HTH domain